MLTNPPTQKFRENTQADFENRPCYLENTSDESTLLFEKCGFVKVKTVFFSRGKDALPVKLDIMVREPERFRMTLKSDRELRDLHYAQYRDIELD